MDIIVNGAQSFIGLFDLGAETFVGWVTGIIPRVLMVLIAMNTIIALIGQDKVEKFAKYCSRYKILTYGVLPFVATITMANPACLTLGKLLPDRLKIGYCDTIFEFVHTNNGFFNHINTGELFVFLGIANGVEALGLSMTELAIRYLLIGIVLNCMSGCVTHFMTGIVMKQQGITLAES